MTIEVDKEDSAENNQPQVKVSEPVVQAATVKPVTAPQAPKSQSNHTSNQGNSTMNNNVVSSRKNYGMSRAATSHAMRSIIEVIDKISEATSDTPVKFTFLGLDGEKEGLLISALVVVATLRNPASDQTFAAHHTLLLGSTAKGVNAVEQSFNGIKYERLVLPCDSYDATLRAKVADAVTAATGGKFKLVDADATVVPVDMDLRSEEAVRNVVANATTAASTLLSSIVSSDGWVIDETVTSKTFQSEIKSSWHHFVDLTAQPVRSDLVLEMSVLAGRNQNTQQGGEFTYNNSQSKQLITQLNGYIDLVSTPPLAGNTFGFGAQSNVAANPDQLKIYTPRLVITNVDSPDEACELPVILQGLATTQVLANDARWVGALVQQHKNGSQHSEGGMNIRDLSAIGLEAPVLSHQGGFAVVNEQQKQGRMPLDSANINEQMLAAAIQTYCNPELLISIDVPECGASSWITSPFAAAGLGDQNAIQDIMQAADMLTGGRCSTIYKAANGGAMKPIIYNDNVFVNLGHYMTNSGLRDIRDIDYLAVLNMTGDTELETINDWANLQANAEVDPMFRLTETRRIQQKLFESMVITGRARRITFNPTFIYSLAQAVFEAGLVYETKVGMSAPQGTSRMVPSYIRNLPTNLGNAGSFVAPGSRRPTANGSTGTGSFGRYAHNHRSNGGAGNF